MCNTTSNHNTDFDFDTQKKIVILRDVEKLPWGEIAKRVRNLRGKKPPPRLCATYYRKFSRAQGVRPTKFQKCGPQKPYTVTPAVKKFLMKKLLALRRTSFCTSTTLQLALAREMNVQISDSYVRKILQNKGYK